MIDSFILLSWVAVRADAGYSKTKPNSALIIYHFKLHYKMTMYKLLRKWGLLAVVPFGLDCGPSCQLISLYSLESSYL